MNGTMSPYGFIIRFGFVSLLTDMVYESALAVQGPLLASVGASAVIVGVVSGLGEATALGGRIISGPLADRTKRYWLFAIAGYVVTAVTVPLMGVVGSAAAVAVLVILERLGKAIRTPSRDTMIASAASAVGSGRGFGIHEVIDQIGAVAGPLIVAWVLAVTANNYGDALGVMVISGVAAVLLLLVLRNRVPNPRLFETPSPGALRSASMGEVPASRRKLPPVFWRYCCFALLSAAGLSTFGVISYVVVQTGVFRAPVIPVLYALAMLVDGAAAFVTGLLYDRFKSRVLFVVPVVAVGIPFCVYCGSSVAVVVGVLLWGIVTGVQESTMRAEMTRLVDAERRATAFGVFAIALGIGALVGGSLAGWLSQVSVWGLCACTAMLQVGAGVVLWTVVHQKRH